MKYGNKLKAKFTAAAIALLPYCAAPAAPAADQSAQPSASKVTASTATESSTLVVGSANSQWTSGEGQSILLSKGSLVVISGDTSIKVQTSVGTVEVPPNQEAVIQQEEGLPVIISAIASRNAAADEGSMECALTVCANDDSSYKVYPGKQIKLTAGEAAQIADVVMVKQPPEVAMLMRQAAGDLASAALTLLSDAGASNRLSAIDACTRTLFNGSADSCGGPSKLYVSEGSRLVALTPGSSPAVVASASTNVKPADKSLQAESLATAQSAQDEHLLNKFDLMNQSTTPRSALGLE